MLKIKCSSCGKEIDYDSKFCMYCGQEVNRPLRIFDKLSGLFSSNKTPKQYYYKFNSVRGEIEEFNEILSKKEYIDKSALLKIKNENKDNYELCINLKKLSNKVKLKSKELELINSFIRNYENIDKIVHEINKKEIKEYYDEFKKNKDKYLLFIEKYKTNISYDEFVTDNVLKYYEDHYNIAKVLLGFEINDYYDFGSDLKVLQDFVEIYENFDVIKILINDEINRRKQVEDNFNSNKPSISEFIDKYKKNISYDFYIEDFKSILKDYQEGHDCCIELSKLPSSYHNDLMAEFLEVYDNFEEISQLINDKYLNDRYELFSNKKADIAQQIDKYQNLTIDEYISNKTDFLNSFSPIHEILEELFNYNFKFNDEDLKIANEFSKLFNEFNGEFPIKIYNSFLNYKSTLEEFINKYEGDFECVEYIFYKNDILENYQNTYEQTCNVIKLRDANELDLSKEEYQKCSNFVNLYDNFDLIVEKNNKCYVEKLNKEFLKYKPSILEFISKFNKDNLFDYYIEDESKPKILKSHKNSYELLSEMKRIPETSNDTVHKFLDIYENFYEVVFQINKNYVTNLYQLNLEKIDEYVSVVNCTQNFYVSNSKLNELLENHDKYLSIVLQLLEYNLNYKYLADETKLLQFPHNSDDLINITPGANKAYVERELKENRELFDTVVIGKPLDINQRKAVVIDEDNTQIIAGAGCGKTLTLQAKAKYLIERHNVNPSEILAISFSNYSANDLNRKMTQIGLNLDVSTFHSLGLDILRKNGVNAKVEEYALNNAIKQYFVSNLINDEDMLQKIIEYFGYYMYPPLDKDKIENIGEVYDYENGMDLETLYSKFEKLRDPTLKKTSLKGEKVKSLEERKIANFLFINGIDYTYEKSYEPKINWQKTRDYLDKVLLSDVEVPKDIKDDLIYQILDYLEIDEIIYWPNTEEEVYKYHPDFYLNDYDIYYEHFGVNRKCLAPWLPARKRMEYKREMRNKQRLHRRYGTTLIETYSYYQSENRLLERLSEKLQEKGVKFHKMDYQQFMIDLLRDEEKINEYWDFIKLVKTFISLFKGNGYSIEKFEEFRKINEETYNGFDKEKHELFLDIVEDIYKYYYEYLKNNSLIDFNDMINDATEKIENNGYYKDYKYILVDEFQDTSHTRFNFLKAIKNDLNAKLVVVGDDWQSIYRFTGCDIDLFTNFENYFENSKTEICYITNTYRNSQSLIDVSGKFIMKNTSQFEKQLNSKANVQINDTIKLYQYLNFLEQPYVFEKIICDIYDASDKNNVNILVLGRNRKDYQRIINDDLFFTTGSLDDKNLKIHYLKNPRISIDYMTVHGSKGLEEENVVLINLENKKSGFPNKIEDDSVLDFVKNEKIEPIEFAEERRLFYVALTRTLKRTYLLAPKDKKSIFVSELMEDIEVIDFEMPESEEVMGDEIRTIASTDGICPDCGTGKINLKFNPKTGKKFFKCSNWPRCDWYGGNFYESVEMLDNPKYCPRCGGILIKKINNKGNAFYGCINYFPHKSCTYTEDIDD